MHLPKPKILPSLLALSLVACGPQDSTVPGSPVLATSAEASLTPIAQNSASDTKSAINQYCVVCHNEQLETAGLRLDTVDLANICAQAEVLEKVIRKLRTGTMPPVGIPSPSPEERHAMVAWLESSLDKVAAANPNPGRTEPLRRLNRTEYQNAIRDLLKLDIDANSLLPPDESGYGFDNVNVGDLTPLLLDRYLSAAQKISRLAIG